MDRPIIIRTTGILNKDTDPQYVQNGDYIHMQDFDFADENMITRTTTKGTVRVLDFGKADLQNQTVRIFVNEPAPIITFTFRDINGNIKASTSLVTSNDVNSTKQAIINFINLLNYQKTIVDFPSENFFDVTIDFAFADYIFEIQGCSVEIIKEAISETGVGNFIPIGSYDMLGTAFYWLTNQRNVRAKTPNGVSDITNDANSRIVVISPNHGLLNFETISINGVTGVPSANGIWTVLVLDANRFVLNNSHFTGTYTGGGDIFKNYFGYGCWGVVQEDLQNDTFSFIPLMRSKELNLVSIKEIYNPKVEIVGDLISGYFTDAYNNPRVIYYRGEFLEDGCIRAINPKGQYAYGQIRNQLRLQQSFTVNDLVLLPQIQTGGSLAPGNWRYAIRFLDENFVETEMSLLSKPIPVYSVPYEEGNFIFGNQNVQGFTTGKINRVLVTGIQAGLFKYIELIAVNYSGGQNNAVAVVSTIVRQEVLGDDQTEIILEHNGNEPDTRFFDTRLIVQVTPNIVTAGDLEIIQNRLLLGDVTTDKSIDFRPWVDTFNYSIKRAGIFGAFGATTFNEFYDPDSVSNASGYQIYEWYRFNVMIELANGKFTDAYFFADIRFINQNEYVWQEFESTNGRDKRDLSQDDFFEYTLGNNQFQFFQYHIEVNNIDWNFQIDGTPVRDFVRSIRICRAERVKEVEASGVVIGSEIFGTLQQQGVRMFPFAVAEISPGNIQPTYGQFAVPFRRLVSFHSPDVLFGQTTIDFDQGGYDIISFGSYVINQTNVGIASGTVQSFRRVFNPTLSTLGSQRITVNGGKYVRQGQTYADPITGVTYFKTDVGFKAEFDSYVLSLDSDITNVSNNFDNGLYHALIFRRRVDKYGGVNANNDILYTGTVIKVNETSGRVFGGDVFTQQTWYKLASYINPTNGIGGDGMNIISQNIVNSNLRVFDSAQSGVVYPVSTQDFVGWLELPGQLRDQITKNSAYNILNQIQYHPVYDPLNLDLGIRNARKHYSQFKPTGSPKDFYRVFLPFDFSDSPQAAGTVMRLVNLNNRLMTIQERGFTLEYFNNQGKLTSDDAGEVLIGDGSVLSRIGNKLSSFGTQHRGSVVIGSSQSGKDLLMYISADYGDILRFGDDGLRSVSLSKNMRLFFKNNLKWVKNAKTPADGFGITGVWDNRQKRFIYTVKAWKVSPFWNSRSLYQVGQTIEFGIIDQGIPQLWTAIQPNSGIMPQGLGNGVWKRHDIRDSEVYNCYTFAWSELKQGGGFTEFLSFLANHYTQFNDDFLSGYSDINSSRRSELHIHNKGLPATYYDVEYSPFLTLVCNWNANLNKKFFSLMMDSSRKPTRVNIKSLFRNEDEESDIELESFLEQSDFTTRESFQYSPVKLVTDANGRNDIDGSQVEGIYCIFEIIFPKGKTSTMNDLIVHIRDSFRNYTK